MQKKLDLLSDGSERVPYNIPDYPVFARRTAVRQAVPPHWHDDLEFSCVLSGRMNFFVNGDVLTLDVGQGIFVNSRQLHANFSWNGTDYRHCSLLVHPSLLGAHPYLQEHCIRPLMDNPAFAFQVFSGDVPWQREVLEGVQEACAAFESGAPEMGMLVQAQASRIAALLLRHMPAAENAVPVDRRLMTLRDMVGYVQKHYAAKVSLGDIAAAGHVSVSTCCDIFRRHMHETPLQYLTHYRLEKAMGLLRNPGLSVTEVALSTGFFGASYFAETFRREHGLSPTRWRRAQSAEARERGEWF